MEPVLSNLLVETARATPAQIAARMDQYTLTYAELETRVRRFAGALIEQGVEPGDKVAIMVPNGVAFTIAYFGTLYAGGTVVSLCTLLAADEVAYQLDHSQARSLVVGGDAVTAGLMGWRVVDCCTSFIMASRGAFAEPLPEGSVALEQMARDGPLLERPAAMEPKATAVIMYTSGTTGRPKGAELSHASLYRNALYVADELLSTDLRSSRPLALAALPLYHSFGQTVVQNATIAAKGTISYLARFSAPDAARLIARDHLNFFAGVPSMYIGLVRCPEVSAETLSSLDCCLSGGAPLPLEVKQEFHRRFGVWIREGYGLTETSPVASFQSREEAPHSSGIGRPIDGVEFRIVDLEDRPLPPGQSGELCICGYNIMNGYYRNPDATAESMRGGWFHSGDVACLGEDGQYHIVDRMKDMVLRGGFNVYPREVEEVLYRHPAVREAAVVGVPHDTLGEEVKAVVTLMPGAQATREELVLHCKQHVAAYKYPRIVEIRDELPKSATGKILKWALRV